VKGRKGEGKGREGRGRTTFIIHPLSQIPGYATARRDDAVTDRLGDVECQQWSDMTQCSCVIAATADHLCNMPVHSRQCRVERDAKKLDRVTEWHNCPPLSESSSVALMYRTGLLLSSQG